MKATYIDYEDTGSFSTAVIRYIESDPALSSFISYTPNIEGFKDAINNRRVTADRTALSTALIRQYSEVSEKIHPSAAVAQNIDLLLSEKTFTVTTGHQLNIFTGPLYFIYKIVTAINLANDLKKEFPDKNFVPVYWMATEDHDFEEINHTYIHGQRITWNQTETGATGRLSTESLQFAMAEYKAILGYSENSLKLGRLVDEAYSAGNLSKATRILVHGLFARYGLVIADADDRELKKQFSSIVYKDILEQNSHNNIKSANAELLKTGIEAQVNPREINFFYLKDQLRERIIRNEDQFEILNSDIRFSKETLLQEITDFPERFSPNVVLRPLYQEVILPNIAYIGGGAEVVYWLQLKKNFDFYNIDFPILILRNSALVTDDKFEKKLSRLEFEAKDIFKKTDQLKKEWMLSHSEHELTLNRELFELETILQGIKYRASAIHPTLGPSTEAIKVRLQKALERLEKKMLLAEKRNHQEILATIDNLKKQYFPNGLQERHENFGTFYTRYGDDFIQTLVKTFKPLDFKFTILIP